MKLAVIVVPQQEYVVANVGHVFTSVVIVAYASIQDGTIIITLSCGRYDNLILLSHILKLHTLSLRMAASLNQSGLTHKC